MSVLIHGDHVGLKYANRGQRLSVFKDLSFVINKGELTSLVGPSGCGKTTLLKMIGGLILPTAGNIVIQESGLGKKTSYVPQNPTLLPFRTVIENVRLPLEIRDHNGLKTVEKLLRKLGLYKFKDFYPGSISGGMQQKVSIARALVTEPNLILMDEPFSALDEISREKIIEEFYQWSKKISTTILFVTHNIEEAAFVSNRVLVFSEKPSQVVSDIKVNLPEQRTSSLRTTPQFFTVSNKIRKALRT